jgi:hypothetical protein
MAEFQKQLVLGSDKTRQIFMERIESELHQKQEELVQQAQRLMEGVADQNQTRIAGLLKELAQGLEIKADPAPKPDRVAG